VINGTLYYPTIPATGEHISVQAATRIEQLLKAAKDSHLRDQVGPLRSAIAADDESGMLSIVGSLQTIVCGPAGYPPIA